MELLELVEELELLDEEEVLEEELLLELDDAELLEEELELDEEELLLLELDVVGLVEVVVVTAVGLLLPLQPATTRPASRARPAQAAGFSGGGLM